MKRKFSKKFSAVVLAAGLVFAGATPSFAGDGYRGGTVNGCRAYIQGKNAWTNCLPATKSFKLATKAWCTGQPTRYGQWYKVKKGAKVYGKSKTSCFISVHTAKTLAQ